MPSSYTASLRFEKQFTGENTNTWGDKIDAMLDRVDDSVAGYVPITLTGDYTLSSANTNTAADEARRAHLKFSGTLAANAIITIPGVSKSYWIWNNTTKTLTITTGAGNTATVEAGDILQVWCDGSNVKGITFGGYDLKTYIGASVLSATGSLPAVTGNAGKYVYTDGVISMWRTPLSADLGDYNTKILGVSIAFAVAL